MENVKKFFTNRTVVITLLLIIFVIVLIYYIKKRKSEDHESSFAEMVRNDAMKNKLTDKEHELYQYLRKIWAENTFWLRNYIISYMNKSSDMNDVTRRLLQNQEQVGRSLGLWYGEDKGKQIASMMQRHLISFGDMLRDMISNNQNGAVVAEKQWHDNTDQLVDYLTKLNPEWDKNELSQHFKKYNEMNITQAMARLKRKHKEEVEAFDQAYTHSMYDLADYISEGIVAQFPKKFDKDKKSIRKIVADLKKGKSDDSDSTDAGKEKTGTITEAKVID